MEFGGGHGAGGIIFLFALSDVTHVRDRGDWKVVRDDAGNPSSMILTLSFDDR